LAFIFFSVGDRGQDRGRAHYILLGGWTKRSGWSRHILYLEDGGKNRDGVSTFFTWRMEETKGVEPVQYILYTWSMEVRRGGTSTFSTWSMEVRRGGTSTFSTWRMEERKGVEPAHWVLSATSKASLM
jgi:hypothetical protein